MGHGIEKEYAFALPRVHDAPIEPVRSNPKETCHETATEFDTFRADARIAFG